MTDDRVEGTLKQGVGRVQDAVGGLTGNTGTQAKGKANEVAGSVQDTVGQVKDRAQDVVGQAKDRAQDVYGEVESYAKEQPLQALAITLGVGVVIGFLLRGGRK